ncbi:antitoxin [Ornithinimicrobium tianjinense]|uniref:MT0933-like antitoxin protein n=1 Tax=Ornithinimicrobium tianjinense TaxID=1195761 RepID=A0A917BGG6_9MICO|nr:antitoxin [Ornithinimicrobium tianjinense]GGF42287.1 hypothetical protein GCM10011366_07620 [Ornithinimicrobium tianjinense]
MDGFLDKAQEQADAMLDKTTLDETAQDAWAEHGDKLDGLVDEHADKIGQGLDGATDFVSDKTGGRFDEQLDQGADSLRGGLDSLDGESGDDFGNA